MFLSLVLQILSKVKDPTPYQTIICMNLASFTWKWVCYIDCQKQVVLLAVFIMTLSSCAWLFSLHFFLTVYSLILFSLKIVDFSWSYKLNHKNFITKVSYEVQFCNWLPLVLMLKKWGSSFDMTEQCLSWCIYMLDF